MAKLEKLKALTNEIHDINMAIALLAWDQETYMPKNGIIDKAEQISTLTKIAHQKFTSKEFAEELEKAKTEIGNVIDDSDDSRLVKVLDRNYKKAVKVPLDLVSATSKACSIGQQTWAEAKSESNFTLFLPILKEIIQLRKEYAKIFAPYENIYDPLLDNYEPNLKTKDVKNIFSALRVEQVKLLNKIKGKNQVDSSFLYKEYDLEKQKLAGITAITKFGFDWNKGRQDKSAHPFCTSFGTNDVRITTRFNKKAMPEAFFGTLHESGHAMYEQGISMKLRRTPLSDGASMSIHESQSRLWENIIGRSKGFWEYFYPQFQSLFKENLENISLEAFYKGINKVEPSLIRVEADEATYNLHIMLRLELEIALMEDEITADQLPEAWNKKVNDYLGIEPTSDATGVLQDIHWSMGGFGYFSTYALGNLVSAQIWNKLTSDLPNSNEKIKNGDFSQILSWLRTNIHVHGAKFEPQELMQKVTGEKINPSYYLNYLNNKYTEIYNL